MFTEQYLESLWHVFGILNLAQDRGGYEKYP